MREQVSPHLPGLATQAVFNGHGAQVFPDVETRGNDRADLGEALQTLSDQAKPAWAVGL